MRKYESFEDIKEYKECGECNKCYTGCPTKSINISKINPNICSSYITQKKELSDIDIKLLKERYLDVIYVKMYVHIIMK